MKQVQKRGNYCQCRDQKAAFNVEAHEAEVAIRELASQCAAKGYYHCRKANKG